MTTTRVASFRKSETRNPEAGLVCVLTLQLQNNSSESVDHARNALRLLCHDGAAGVDVARDEAVQLRPLGERHHQGGGRGSLLDLGPSRWCHGEGSDGEGGGGGGGGLGNGGGCGDTRKRS